MVSLAFILTGKKQIDDQVLSEGATVGIVLGLVVTVLVVAVAVVLVQLRRRMKKSTQRGCKGTFWKYISEHTAHVAG